MTQNDAIAYSLTTSQKLLRRYVDDLTPAEYLHRPAPNANCTAWTIGHLVLTERTLLRRLGLAEGDLPPLPDGQFEKRFSRDEGCPQAGEFGDVTGLMALFDTHRERAIDVVRRAPADLLARPLDKPHPIFATAGEFADFVALHAVLHAGQITIIRRSLGRPPLV
jgi:hypothetical protein